MHKFFDKHKKYFSKKYQKTKSNLQDLRSKAVTRFANLAKRLDQSHSHDERKK